MATFEMIFLSFGICFVGACLLMLLPSSITLCVRYAGLEQAFWSAKYSTVIGGTLSPGPAWSLPDVFKPRVCMLMNDVCVYCVLFICRISSLSYVCTYIEIIGGWPAWDRRGCCRNSWYKRCYYMFMQCEYIIRIYYQVECLQDHWLTVLASHGMEQLRE